MPTAALPTIHALSPELINRIAAGEVVDRPASLVKELLENALDAGATRIELQASNGGRTLRIADNGCGMSPEDLPLAFAAHSTSKLNQWEDLQRLGSFGFRGEALASLSAVAKVQCQSRTQQANHGFQLQITDSQLSPVQPCACAPGTILQVEDLFYNTPARLKFLKRPATELAFIEETVQALALAHPHVAWQYTQNGKTVFEVPATTQAAEAACDADLEAELKRLQSLLKLGLSSAPLKQQLLRLDFEDPTVGYRVSGWVASPSATEFHKRSRTKARWLFVNQRWVRCTTLSAALERAFESLVPHGQTPLAVIQLHLPPAEVDVNVHPRKQEVRYAQPNQVFQLVHHAAQQALQQQFVPSQLGELAQSAPAVQPSSWNSSSPFTSVSPSPFPKNNFQPQDLEPALNLSRPLFQPYPASVSSPEVDPAAYSSEEPSSLPVQGTEAQETPAQEAVQLPNWQVIGQLYRTYILLETPRGLMVVDQHIASERACFEALMRQEEQETPSVQRLLSPLPVTLSAELAELLQTHAPAVQSLGFEWEATETGVNLLGVPNVYTHRPQLSPTQQLLHVLERLRESQETGSSTVKADRENLVATLACHSAIRAGDVLSPEQMRLTVEAWLACTLPWTCPHGRPIAHTIKAQELNDFFHRPSLPVGTQTT